ncbi:hypothetical protein [Maribacter arenosus]|uniref:Fibronectin type-III domain-containing protein n=1 Tax=Maribacter arenosus TaxID=1854708 RepID=A0ABR7V7V4_9FLAO|nr:hypothetical protein [Maribacter arenosus]MBD0849740.1 hypothetical protein [Maribacter arenosus]
MKRKTLYYLLGCLFVVGSVVNSCQKDDVSEEQQPVTSAKSVGTVTTVNASNITENSATTGGNVIDDGGATITARGVCWSTSENPSVSDSKTADGNGKGSFTSDLSNLSSSTTYYVKAYATNSEGTAYGNQVEFTTITSPVVLTTVAISNITENSATSGGNITDDGGVPITARGVCWSTSENPTITDSKTTDGSGAGSFTSELTDLSPSTTYYVKAYASNSEDTAYGNQIEFTTSAYDPPTISAAATSDGTFTVAISYSSWPYYLGTWDTYELEESTVSSSSGFELIHTSNTHTSPYNVQLTRTPGTYYYRARITKNTPNGYSSYSEVVSVVVSAPVRSIKFINNTSSNVYLKEIVQIKVARYANDVYTRADLLTNDNESDCLYLPGESIAQGESETFEITIGPNYSVFIGMGIWDLDNVTCPLYYNWFKRTWGMTTTNDMFWIWTVVNVTDENSEDWNWTISGSYMDGTLKVTPSGDSPIDFVATPYNPIN